MLWAQQMAKDTNRAQDEGYLQQLADRWVMKGERKRAWTPGFGADATFGEAVRTGKADTWIPDMPDEGTANQIKGVFKANPDVHKQWLDAYDGDEDAAVRAYNKKLMLQSIGPRTAK
jgi:hypothetical protein